MQSTKHQANRIASGAAALLVAASLGTPLSAQPLDRTEISAVALEAYTYLYPLVTMDVTRQVMTNLPAGHGLGFGPANTFVHMRAYPDAEMRQVVRPNFDTLYSSAWLDLTREPVIVSMPETGDRYYTLPFYDMWTDVFAAPGWRTSGTGAAHWAIVPPGWQGELPTGTSRIDAPTNHVWIIGRIQTNGPDDYADVNALQDRMAIVPLSQWGGDSQAAIAASDPAVDVKTEPLMQVNAMPAGAYFARAGELLKSYPPHAADWSVLERMRRLGLEAGKTFDIEALDPEARTALEAAPVQAQTLFKTALPGVGLVRNGWLITRSGLGVYGNDYLKRAVTTMVGLGAVPPEDAVYPLALADAEGEPLTGEHDYVLHVEKDELPPARAFWSVTMYDAEGFQVANPLNRFAIGDRDALRFNSDGSLDIYLQHKSPGKDRESNWLPAPEKGVLGVTMRLFAPETEVLDGRWVPPALTRVR